MVSFILSFATSPLANTKQAIHNFAGGCTPINPPTAQHREAPAALTSALATLGLVSVPLPANIMLAINTINTDQTVKFLCFPVTSATDGNPHYLFGAYIPGAHLLFPCCACSRALIQLTQDKHNWFHTTMITGYCGWNIGSSIAYYMCHFDPTFTPASINNNLPTAQAPVQHHVSPTA
eukprot:jgi/Psemu1/41256/gm1.41256_g